MLVTEKGIVKDVNPTQEAKAPPSILLRVLGNVRVVRLLHPLYLQPIITQYFIDNKSEIWLLFLIAHSKR